MRLRSRPTGRARLTVFGWVLGRRPARRPSAGAGRRHLLRYWVRVRAEPARSAFVERDAGRGRPGSSSASRVIGCGDVRVAVAVAADPRAEDEIGRGVRGRSTPPAQRPLGRAVEASAPDGNSVSSKTAMVVRTSSSGCELRRADQRGTPQRRDLFPRRRRSSRRTSSGQVEGVADPVQRGDRGAPAGSVGCAVRTGCTSSPGSGGACSAELVPPDQPGERVGPVQRSRLRSARKRWRSSPG